MGADTVDVDGGHDGGLAIGGGRGSHRGGEFADGRWRVGRVLDDVDVWLPLCLGRLSDP